MHKATFHAGVGRGVWVAPWMGMNGETILVAVRHDNRLVAEYALSFGDDHVAASEALWAQLELADPQPELKVI